MNDRGLAVKRVLFQAKTRRAKPWSPTSWKSNFMDMTGPETESNWKTPIFLRFEGEHMHVIEPAQETPMWLDDQRVGE